MRTLLITCILIGLAAVAAPQIFTRYMRPTNAEANLAASSEASADPAAAPASGPRQVEIQAERDGHFYVDAQINFQPVRLMVDTGATVVALRASDAALAGIRPVPSDFKNPVQTANGTTMAAETVLDSVSVNDIEVHHIRALVVPDEQLSLSLLGGSFLNGVQRFQVTDGTLTIEN